MARPEIPLTESQSRLVEQNVRLAYAEGLRANRLRRAVRLTLEEATSAALFGLIRAAQYYNPDYGTKFSTYAVSVIRNQIHRADIESSIIHTGAYMADEAERHRQGGTVKSARKTIQDAVRARGTSLVPLGVGRGFWAEHSSLQRSDNTEEWIEAEHRKQLHERVHQALKNLPKNLADLLHKRFMEGSNLNYREIGKQFGIPKESARRLVLSGLRRMRRSLQDLEGVV